MKAVYALYSTGDAAQRAVNSLRSAGYGDDDITVISGAPMEEYEFSHIGQRSFQWYVAAGGGPPRPALSSAFIVYAEKDWPINVGNMPIVAWYPNLIVVFEMTMLGAILATVLMLIFAGGLGRKMPVLYDPEVTNGKILVGIADPGDAKRGDIERALLAGSGAQLKTI